MEEFKLLPKESAFFDLTPDQVTVIFYALGIGLAESLTIDELRIIGTGLFVTGEVILAILAQRLLINDLLAAQQKLEDTEKIKQEKQSMEDLQSQFKNLQIQFQYLQKQLDLLTNK